MFGGVKNVSYICWSINQLKSTIMQKGQKVNVNLNAENAKALGINGAVQSTGIIDGVYDNGVEGYYVKVGQKLMAIPAKYNAVTPVVPA